jgi:hypothetical protein
MHTRAAAGIAGHGGTSALVVCVFVCVNLSPLRGGGGGGHHVHGRVTVDGGQWLDGVVDRQ